MRDHRQLLVWQKAHAVMLAVYALTREFPSDERFGLTSQLRRCAVSVPSNIAEGTGRSSDPDFARFLDIASGSANELEYQVLLAHDLGYLDATQHNVLSAQISEVRRLLTRFRQRLIS